MCPPDMKHQIITRVRNLTSMQQGGPAKLSTYKMGTIINGTATTTNASMGCVNNDTGEDQNAISSNISSATRESKV